MQGSPKTPRSSQKTQPSPTLPQGKETPPSRKTHSAQDTQPFRRKTDSATGQLSSNSAPNITPPQVPGKATTENNQQVQEILKVIFANMDGSKTDPDDRAQFPLIANKLIELGEYIQTIKGPLNEDLNQQLNQLVHDLIKDERFLSDKGKLWAIHVDAVWLAHQMRKNDRINQNTWTTTWLTQEKENDILRIAGDTLARAEQDPDLSNKIHPSLRYNYNCIRNLWSPSRQYTISRDTEKRILALEDDKKILEEQNRTQHQKLLQQGRSLEQMDQKLRNAHEQIQKNEQLQKEIELLKPQLEQQNKSSEDVKRAAEDASKKFAEENEQFQKNLAKKEKEIEKEKKISEHYKNANLKSTNENLGLKSQIGTLTGKAKTDKTEIEKLKNAKTALEKAQEQQNIEIETQKKENQNLQIKNQQLQDQLDQQVKTIEKQKAKIDQLDESVKQEADNNDALIAKVSQEEAKFKQLSEEKDHLTKDLEQQIKNLSEIEQKNIEALKLKAQEIDNLNQKNSDQENELKTKDQELQKALETVTKNNIQFQKTTENLAKANADLQEESEKVQNENEQLKQNLKKGEENLQEEKEKFEEQNKKLLQEIESLKATRENQQKEIDRLKTDVGESKERQEILEKLKSFQKTALEIDSKITNWQKAAKDFQQGTHFFELPSPNLESFLNRIEQLNILSQELKAITNQSKILAANTNQLKDFDKKAETLSEQILLLHRTLTETAEQIEQKKLILEKLIHEQANLEKIKQRDVVSQINKLNIKEKPINQEDILNKKYNAINNFYLKAIDLEKDSNIEFLNEIDKNKLKKFIEDSKSWLANLKAIRENKNNENLFGQSEQLLIEAFHILNLNEKISSIAEHLKTIAPLITTAKTIFHDTQKEILQTLNNIKSNNPNLKEDFPSYWELLQSHANAYENHNEILNKAKTLEELGTLQKNAIKNLSEIKELETTIVRQQELKKTEETFALKKGNTPKLQFEISNEITKLQKILKQVSELKDIVSKNYQLNINLCESNINDRFPYENTFIKEAEEWLDNAQKSLSDTEETSDINVLNEKLVILKKLNSSEILENLNISNKKINTQNVILQTKQREKLNREIKASYDAIKQKFLQLNVEFKNLKKYRSGIDLENLRNNFQDSELKFRSIQLSAQKSNNTVEVIRNLSLSLPKTTNQYLNDIEKNQKNIQEQIKFYKITLPQIKKFQLTSNFKDIAKEIENIQARLASNPNVIVDNELLQRIINLNNTIPDIQEKLKPKVELYTLTDLILKNLTVQTNPHNILQVTLPNEERKNISPENKKISEEIAKMHKALIQIKEDIISKELTIDQILAIQTGLEKILQETKLYNLKLQEAYRILIAFKETQIARRKELLAKGDTKEGESEITLGIEGDRESLKNLENNFKQIEAILNIYITQNLIEFTGKTNWENYNLLSSINGKIHKEYTDLSYPTKVTKDEELAIHVLKNLLVELNNTIIELLQIDPKNTIKISKLQNQLQKQINVITSFKTKTGDIEIVKFLKNTEILTDINVYLESLIIS